LNPFVANDVANYHWNVSDIADSERRIEIAIGEHFLKRNYGKYVLEVGNTLVQYIGGMHTIVDLTDSTFGAHRMDIMDFHPDDPFEVIVSISTVEHVGFDEDDHDPDKGERAIAHMKSMLAPGGCMLLTWAINYNVNLDERLFAGRIPMHENLFYRRVDAANNWEPCTESEVRECQFFKPFKYANGLYVGYYYQNESNDP
jgi:hypothetical protein